ncbi:OmpA family protein [Odoribacter lunatus]|uniref:OmpA family protein n=1 Tax=Odoribacter lunatus TaxID=2941335 RepID=UPI00203C4E18|nr:OmpA family protein [Odoribacter lunatus]
MKYFIGITLFILLLCSSCVSKKKYLIAENGRLAALEREETLRGQLGNANQKNEGLDRQIENLKNDTVELGGKIRAYRSLLFSNKSEQEKLNALLEEKTLELKEREATIRELQEMINLQNEKVSSLLENVQDALLGFGNDELSVTRHDGKIYVAMSDKLLFQSGSAQVDKRGKEALAKLAEVLNKQSDIDVFIEGHTDNKPINTVQFKDNWDLSVIRATSVVRILTEEYHVQPLQIQPTGRGEYMPVSDNATAEGRTSNRRTEIIMAPKLDKLMKLLQQNQ